MTLTQPQVIRSKKSKAAAIHEIKLVGPINISGTRPPKDDEDPFMMVEITAFGLSAWVPVSRNVPQVEGADLVILQARPAKTKTKGFALSLGGLLSISVDGEVVWTGDPVVQGAAPEIDLAADKVSLPASVKK